VTLADVRQDLRKVIDESRDVARTYYKLFDVAKSLQNEDLQKKANELDEAHAQRSEATIALARHVSVHNDKCEQYERELAEFKDKAAQSVDILSHFIHQNLGETMQSATQEQITEVLQALFEMRSDTHYSSNHVSSDLYQDLQRTLARSNDERDGLRDVCSQQMATIQEQSKDLDQYIARMAKVINIVQEKERQTQSLREELVAAKEQCRVEKEGAGMQTQDNREQKSSPVGESGSDALHRSLVGEVWKRDAEITNLRRKLEKAYTRETGLQAQIRQLLQSSQGDHPDKPSRLKRFLTGHQKSSPNIPTLNSMQNLSHSVFTPFQKEKPQVQRSPSPSKSGKSGKSGKSSPMLGAFCEPGSNLDNLELPAAHQQEDSAPNVPPRMREAVRYPQDEIDSAVSNRFYQLPANVRSMASTPRPITPKSSSTSSNDEISDYRRGRPRFNSDPGVHESATSDRFAYDRKPLLDHSRVLSGITEVTEDGGSFKRKNSSPDSMDKKMYLDSMHAAKALGGLQIG